MEREIEIFYNYFVFAFLSNFEILNIYFDQIWYFSPLKWLNFKPLYLKNKKCGNFEKSHNWSLIQLKDNIKSDFFITMFIYLLLNFEILNIY